METLNTQLQPFFEWLLRATLQASLMVCLILLLQRILRSKLGIRWHYGLWMLLLIRMSLPWAPQSKASLFNLIPQSVYQQQIEYVQPETNEQKVGTNVKSSAPVEAAPASGAVTIQKSPDAVSATPTIKQDVQYQFKPDLSKVIKLLPMFWLTGALVLAVYVCVGNFNLWRIVKSQRPLIDQKILELLEDCKSQMGIQTILGIVTTNKVKSPALFGFIRPRLLLPTGMIENLRREELRFVFLHELAHLKRRDIYIGWLISLLQVLHWFNPLVWLAFRRMRADRELACDALVLDRTQSDEPKSYGRIIVSLLERFSRPRFLPGLAGILESKSQLKRRITMIAKFKKNSYQWSPLAIILIIILACVSLPDARHTKGSEASASDSAYQQNFRKIWIPTKPGNGVLSPDGEKLAFISEGSLWIVPVHGKVSPDIAGEPVRLTEPMGAWDVASFIAWSVDGKWIAFNVSDEKEDAIYVIPSSGGTPRKVPVEPLLRNSVPNYRLSLSPDGKVVAFSSRHIEEPGAAPPEETGLPPSVRGFFIYTVPVAGGEVKRLTDSASGEPAFSPDGKKIAFVKYYTSEQGKLCGSLWVVPSEGGSPVQVSDSDPQIRVGGPVWSPDGKMIAYTTRTIFARKEVCIVPVSEIGKALASPAKIELPLNTLDMLAGWTRDNKIGVFLHKPSQWAIHTVPASGGHAVQVSPSGGAAHPQWSPDGKRIYFRWDGGEIAHVPSGGGALSIGPVKRDETFYLVYPGSGNAVSPDGREIVFCAGKRISPNNKEPYWEVNIYTVPVEGSEPTKIAQEGRYPCWSPDGKSIAFIRTNQRPVKNESGWNIYIVSSKGGDVRQLTSDSDDVRRTYIDFSPDGKSIAYFAKDKTLRIIPVQGGESRIVATAEELKNHDQLAWSPDGSKLVYSSKGSIWEVSSDGGEPAEIRTGLDAKAAHVSFSPDGRKLAFTAITDGEEDLYLIENFLPESKIVKSKPTPTLRQIEVRGRGSVHSIPSFDGKYILDVDKTGNLVAREVDTGKERLLTNNTDPNWFVHGSSISRDSKKVAFYHYNPNKDDFDLRIVGIDGSGLRTLLGAEIAGYFNIHAWSPDGKYIFGMLMKKPFQLARISLDDGSMEVLKTFEQGSAARIDASPDGRYLAYSRAEQKNSKPDIFIHDLEQNITASLVTHPAADKLLGWTPDGQHIFFTSDRNGTWDGWLVEVVDGKPVGLPEIIKAGIGDVGPIGFTQSGAFYYAFNHQAWNVYMGELDRNTGQVVSEPVPVRLVGKDFCPDFSPDGRYLAYLSQPDRSKPQVIRIRTLATGQERELKPDLPRFERLHWCPDSRHLLITFFRSVGSPSPVYTVDIQTGEYKILAQIEGRNIRQAVLSADGKTLIYRKPGLYVTPIIARDIETGNEKELFQFEGPQVAFWSISPDGKEVAYSIREGESGTPFVLKIMSVETGESRTLVEDAGFFPVWSSDGRDVYFTRLNELSRVSELWRVSASGSEPRKLMEWKEMIMIPCIHPDGQRIAFHSGGYVSEMWVMENFLPTTVAVTRK